MSVLYADLQPGDTLVSSCNDEDVWTVVSRNVNPTYCESISITWLRHSTSKLEIVHFDPKFTVPMRFQLYRVRVA